MVIFLPHQPWPFLPVGQDEKQIMAIGREYRSAWMPSGTSGKSFADGLSTYIFPLVYYIYNISLV